LHTVIITDRQTTSLFYDYKRLFAPFLTERDGSVCQCQWYETGDNIEESVPDLYKSIKDHPEWRAIILINPEKNELLPFSSNNPFDFHCNRAKELLIQENKAPLVRLTHMLAGFPPLGVKGYETGYVYYDVKTGTYKECTFKEGTYKGKPILQSIVEKKVDEAADKKFEEKYKQKGQPVPKTDKEFQKEYEAYKDKLRSNFEEKNIKKFGSNIKLKLVEVPYSPGEKARYKKLTEKYALKENRPAEVLLLSTRKIYVADDHEVTRETVRRAWQFHDEEDSSDFWKIYPNTCRFICYDLINPEHTLYYKELWRFFLLALTLAVNEIPGQALQAYRLYNADLNINAEDLRDALDKHMENLLSVQAIIQERMLRMPELTQEKKKELVPSKNISVKFENVDEGDLKVDGSELGLASDCPVSETKFWHNYIQSTKQTIDNILSAPQEIVAMKALETRTTINSFSGKEQVLDRFQKERIHKRINELELQVINSNVYGLLDSDAYMAEIADAGATVRKSMGLRLTKSNVLLISLFSFLVYLCGYIPYMVNSAKISKQAFGASFGLAVVALALLAAGGFLVLRVLRRRLLDKLKTYNRTVRAIFDRVNVSARFYADYFSSVCTYMYAQSLLSGVILKNDNDYSEAKLLKAHLSFLEYEIETGKKLCSLHGAPSKASTLNSACADVNEGVFSESPAGSRFYELATFKGENTMKLTASSKTQQTQNLLPNSSSDEWDQYDTGITLNAPYSFIKSLNIAREEIYDEEIEEKEIDDKDGA
jgi:hypothetical protein